MGHHWLPVPSNFPAPGNQVRHSPLVTVKCLSTSPCWHGNEITWSLWKGCSSPNNKWSLNWVLAANQGRLVGSCSVPVGSWLQPGGKGVWGTHKRDVSLVCWWYDRMTGRGVVCAYGVDRQEITPADVGEAVACSVIRHDCRPHGCCVAQCPVAVDPLIYTYFIN